MSQHNVLILIGQRRTGKTSFLLRLRQHLPENQLPVYIDCQSLGLFLACPRCCTSWPGKSPMR
ncbi:MAG: hypothetical protein IPJ94_25835 [Chloroflexi bacterium]|nr:hypothetical protein [Chloroflexota bacterium]